MMIDGRTSGGVVSDGKDPGKWGASLAPTRNPVSSSQHCFYNTTWSYRHNAWMLRNRVRLNGNAVRVERISTGSGRLDKYARLTKLYTLRPLESCWPSNNNLHHFKQIAAWNLLAVRNYRNRDIVGLVCTPYSDFLFFFSVLSRLSLDTVWRQRIARNTMWRPI